MITKQVKEQLDQEAKNITLELYNIKQRKKGLSKRLLEIQSQNNVLTAIVNEEEKLAMVPEKEE